VVLLSVDLQNRIPLRKTYVLPPRTDTIVRSPIATRFAIHILYIGSWQIDVSAASPAIWSDDRLILDPDPTCVAP
jgi:hypothetical protein